MDGCRLSAEERDEALTLLQGLIRIDTSNPPGEEAAAIQLLEQRCEALGLATEVVGAIPERPNLIATFPADPDRRTDRPLVLSCHVDTVPADPDRWTHSPWSGHCDGNYVWGRGAIDMKGFAAMAFAVVAKLKRLDIPLRRDLLFVAVSDEEAGTRLGSRWLVDERPDLLRNPEYVINEVGGFTTHREGNRFYPVQVAEKGVAWLRLAVCGESGHSSLPGTDSAVARLGRAVNLITHTRLPWHPSPEAQRLLEGFAAPRGYVGRQIASLISHPRIGPHLLPRMVREPSRRASLEAILRNTATPTSLCEGGNINMLPGMALVDIDGRLAPGQTTDDLIAELDAILFPLLGKDYALTVLHDSAPVSFPLDTPLYREIEETILAADPGSYVVPSVIPGFTDSHNYARLGAVCYGFYPLRLPEDLDFTSLFHGENERIPLDGFYWGIEVLAGMLERFLTR